MSLRFINIIFLYFICHHTALAIFPVYAGANGIKEEVFATHCLFCHSSTLIGSQRNGAPPNINFDTYTGALESADKIIMRAVDEMTMPPLSSGLPSLNQQQKEALLKWQETGFLTGQTSSNTSMAIFDFSSFVLIIPVIYVNDLTYQATFKLINIPNSPLGFGFILESADLTNKISETSAIFSPEEGVLKIPEIILLNSNDGSSKVEAEMQLKPNSSPMQFEVTSVN